MEHEKEVQRKSAIYKLDTPTKCILPCIPLIFLDRNPCVSLAFYSVFVSACSAFVFLRPASLVRSLAFEHLALPVHPYCKLPVRFLIGSFLLSRCDPRVPLCIFCCFLTPTDPNFQRLGLNRTLYVPLHVSTHVSWA